MGYGREVSATRLLVLGAIHILQPVHGYDVRRELVSWRLEDIAHVKSGSIYSAIRTLEKDGCIRAHSRESEHSRPERTTYVLTPEGHKEFQQLLRRAWWEVTPATEPLIPPMCLMLFLPREELIAALQSRIARLSAELDAARFQRSSISDGATGADGGIPEHVREILDFTTAKTVAELEWTRGLRRRLQQGHYVFVGEPGFPTGPNRPIVNQA